MKFKTTKKAIKSHYYTIIAVGYCDLQDLLHYENPIAYTCGVYGWNADIYDIDGVAIVTGYRPFGEHIDYDVVDAYNKAAKKFIIDKFDNGCWDTDQLKAGLHEMVREFVRVAKEKLDN